VTTRWQASWINWYKISFTFLPHSKKKRITDLFLQVNQRKSKLLNDFSQESDFMIVWYQLTHPVFSCRNCHSFFWSLRPKFFPPSDEKQRVYLVYSDEKLQLILSFPITLGPYYQHHTHRLVPSFSWLHQWTRETPVAFTCGLMNRQNSNVSWISRRLFSFVGSLTSKSAILFHILHRDRSRTSLSSRHSWTKCDISTGWFFSATKGVRGMIIARSRDGLFCRWRPRNVYLITMWCGVKHEDCQDRVYKADLWDFYYLKWFRTISSFITFKKYATFYRKMRCFGLTFHFISSFL